MALFPATTTNLTQKGKTFTSLVVSDGNVPAEKFIYSASEAVKFTYAYGPTGTQGVTIPKGKVVEPAGLEWDYETSTRVSSLKIADPGSTKAIGVNLFNVYERKRDKYAGNAPTVITKQYIEVPFIQTSNLDLSEAIAKGIHYGAAYGATSSALAPGDYVKVGAYGNFAKWDSSTDIDPMKIVGQVWTVETDLPPLGMLEYFHDLTSNELKELIKLTIDKPSPGRSSRGSANSATTGTYGYDPAFGSMDKNEWVKRQDYWTGIPFLTDGYFKARTDVPAFTTAKTDATTYASGYIDSVRVVGNVVYDNATGRFTVTDYRGSMIMVKLNVDICQDEASTLAVKLLQDAATPTVSAANTHVDYYNRTIVIYFSENIADPTLIQIAGTFIVDPIAGIPTDWDFQGTLGAVRILLK